MADDPTRTGPAPHTPHHVQRPATTPDRVVTVGSLDDALDLLATHGATARPIAGGTDLLVEFDRAARTGVDLLIDLTRIPGLDTITTIDDGRIQLGATVTHNQVVASPTLTDAARPLVQACWEVGSPALRNRATIVGNVVTASPANDTLSALVVLDAHVHVASAARGTRRVPLHEFHTGVRRTVLADDELVTAIDLEPLGPEDRAVYVKGGLRRAQAISVVHAAVRLTLADATITAARVALGSVAPTVDRVEVIEAALVGRSITPDALPALVAELETVAAEAVRPIDDLRADATYRHDLSGVMVARAVHALATDTVPAGPDRAIRLWGTGDGHAVTGAGHAADHGPTTPIGAVVNGHDIAAPGSDRTLLHWLRDTGHDGVKEGCAEGECGACTVEVDGLAVLSCLVPATRAHGTRIRTVEGLATGDGLHPVQQGFVDATAVQCGYCTPGLLMAAASLLDEVDQPDAGDIRQALAGNLCRCTGYTSVVDAVLRASDGRVAVPAGGATP